MSQYVSATQLATHLGLSQNLTAANVEMLERAIKTASAQIDGLCGRTFAAVSEQRFFTAQSPALLDVGYVTTISSVDVDSVGDYTYATNIPNTDYLISPGKRKYITLKTSAAATFPLNLSGIRITGLFGEATTPPEIEEACILQAARLWKRKDAVFGEIRGDNGFMRIQGAFDVDARQVLVDGGWMKTSRMVIV